MGRTTSEHAFMSAVSTPIIAAVAPSVPAKPATSGFASIVLAR